MQHLLDAVSEVVNAHEVVLRACSEMAVRAAVISRSQANTHVPLSTSHHALFLAQCCMSEAASGLVSL